MNGIPASRSGSWYRWEQVFTSYTYDTIGHLNFALYGFEDNDIEFMIADAALIELPAAPLKPFLKGDGVVFRGGPGALPMRVEEVTSNESSVTVRTTGAVYVFDTRKDVLFMQQELEKKRESARWRFSLPLRGLSLIHRSPVEAVLMNDAMTIGVQCDSMMVISPHARDLSMTAESSLGVWNRLSKGHLIAVDEYGGLTVNPHIPEGTGRLPRTAISGTLDFPVDAGSDVTHVRTAARTWNVAWTVSPGERLGISVFPPRPYPWKESFRSGYVLANRSDSPSKYTLSRNVDIVLLWSSFFRKAGWGMSYGTKYEVNYEDDFIAHIKAVRDAGLIPVHFMSQYFYCTKDPSIFIDEVKRFKDTYGRYGLKGFYSDGEYPQDWIIAYELMRMGRALFPDGTIIIHATGKSGNGGPPMAKPDIFIPAVNTYASMTLKAEGIAGRGIDWPLHQFTTSQFRQANCIGLQKPDEWEGVSIIEGYMQSLIHNGRARCWGDEAAYEHIYIPALRELEKEWMTHGAEHDFYERFYRPKAIELMQRYRPVMDALKELWPDHKHRPTDIDAYNKKVIELTERSNKR